VVCFRCLGIVALVSLMSPCLLADDWPAAQVKEIFSQNRDYFVRITPGESLGETWGFKGAKIGKHAHAEFFRVQADRGYRLDREIDLLNPIAPVDFFVSNAGDLVTLDNWHNVGYGAVLVFYRHDGKRMRAFSLADLFPRSELESFPKSESSVWWHKGPKYIDETQKIFYMGYHEPPDYRELILNLQDASVRMCASQPKYHCRTASH
jgi:hypothetical protein